MISRRHFLRGGAGAALALAVPPGRAQKSPARSIDVHTHWTPEAYRKAMVELGHAGDLDANPLTFDLDKRRRWMDEHGVQMHVLTLSGRMPWQWVDPETGAALARTMNDAAMAAHLAFPDRFLGGITVSIRSPRLALEELERVAGKPGMRALNLPNSIEGKDYLFDPAYHPLLARCEQLGYPLLFHPLDGDLNYYAPPHLVDPLSARTNLANTLGFPFETATTAAKFIVTGTLDKFPKLEIVLPHSGGVFPYLAGRVEHGLKRKEFPLAHSFEDYIRRFHYDTLAYYPKTLRFLIDTVGADRVVIGTDNYAFMDVEHPNALVEQLKLPRADRERILRGNAQRLFKIA
jgi:aminocarboxymuconate-semialdehyde decarboxylase